MEQEQGSEGGSGGYLPQGCILSGRYEIARLIGVGGMGCVYHARDLLLDSKEIALKTLHQSSLESKSHLQRFLREVALTQEIIHENVVRTFDVDSDHDSDVTYFTMELIRGQSLESLVSSNNFDRFMVLPIGLQVCRGLEAVHSCGIIHRDLTTGNVLLLERGRVKIADFGIARPLISHLTNHNQLIGSAEYLAPEIWRGEKLTHAVDLYSLGVILYELTTGVLPFPSNHPAKLLQQHVYVLPIPPSEQNSLVPAWLDQLILALLAKPADARPNSAAEVAAVLERYLDDLPNLGTAIGTKDPGMPTPESERHVFQTRQTREVPISPIVPAGVSSRVLDPSEADTLSIKKQKVLLVDDCEDTRMMLAHMLQREMYEIVQAANGLEALEKVYRERPSAILCDLHMPQMDGREFIERLAGNRSTRDIPVMMLTNRQETESEIELINAGARDYVSKSSNPRLIISRIRRFLAHI